MAPFYGRVIEVITSLQRRYRAEIYENTKAAIPKNRGQQSIEGVAAYRWHQISTTPIVHRPDVMPLSDSYWNMSLCCFIAALHCCLAGVDIAA